MQRLGVVALVTVSLAACAAGQAQQDQAAVNLVRARAQLDDDAIAMFPHVKASDAEACRAQSTLALGVSAQQRALLACLHAGELRAAGR